MIKKVSLAVAVLVVGFIVLVATRSSTYSVERTAAMDAPPEVVFESVNDFHHWSAWSPWEKLDPALVKGYEGAESGQGAIYTWSGDQKVGKGRMTITESAANERIVISLEFLEPWQSTNTTTFVFAPTEKGTSVTWRTEGHKNFSAKAAGMFMDMEKMLGSDLDTGLAELKTVAEAEAKKRADEAAAREAAALAAAEEAAEAAAAESPEAPAAADEAQ